MQPSTEPMVNNSESSVYSRDDNNPPKARGQCPPVASPHFGSRTVQHGNGTDVGTKIFFHCGSAYQLVGNEKISCVVKGSSTGWNGTFPECQAVPSLRSEFGFKVAVIASIISSGIILLLSTAFLTCCLIKCVKKTGRRNQQRGVQSWFQIECDVMEDPGNSYYGNKGRNYYNNNNNNCCCNKLRDTRLVTDVERGLENQGFCRCQEQLLKDFRVTGSGGGNEAPGNSQPQNTHISKQSRLARSEPGQESAPAKHTVLTHAAVHQTRNKEGHHIPSHPA